MSDKLAVTISRFQPARVLNLRGTGDGVPTIGEALSLPTWTVLGLGPDECLAIADEGSTETPPDFANLSLTDVSHAWEGFRLEGADVRTVLAKGCRIDLHPSSFAKGQCRQTLLARVHVTLWRSDDEHYVLLVRPSFADYVEEWLNAARAGI